MVEEYSLEYGEKLVKLARKAINYALTSGFKYSEINEESLFDEKRGVFVTLKKYPSKELRGCIGYASPVRDLWNSVIEVGTSAATKDPRFDKMQSSELNEVIVEVSILTEPVLVKDKENIEQEIEIGKHGLIVKKGGFFGLLLPEVATEFNFDEKEFLIQTCSKAGLPSKAWQNKDTHVFKFEAVVFEEETPNGKIVKKSSNN